MRDERDPLVPRRGTTAARMRASLELFALVESSACLENIHGKPTETVTVRSANDNTNNAITRSWRRYQIIVECQCAKIK